MSRTIEGDDQYKFKLAMYPMILFGLGEVLGCFFIGLIVDRFGSKVAAVCNIIIMLTMTSVTLLYAMIY